MEDWHKAALDLQRELSKQKSIEELTVSVSSHRGMFALEVLLVSNEPVIIPDRDFSITVTRYKRCKVS